MTDRPRHVLSASKIDLFEMCPRRYERRYVTGIKGGTTEAMFTGSAVHAALEKASLARLDPWGELSPQDPLTHEELFGFCSGEDEKAAVEEIETLPSLRDMIGVEVKVGFGWERGSEFVEVLPGIAFMGVFDRFDRCGSAHTVVDYKLGGDRPDISIFRASWQPRGYAFLGRHLTGSPVAVRFDWVQIGRNRFMQPEEFSLRKFQRDIAAVVSELEVYEDENSFPERPGPHCSDCPIAEVCQGYRSWITTEAARGYLFDGLHEEAPLADLLRARKWLKGVEKVVEASRKAFDVRLLRLINDAGGKPIVAGSLRGRRQQSSVPWSYQVELETAISEALSSGVEFKGDEEFTKTDWTGFAKFVAQSLGTKPARKFLDGLRTRADAWHVRIDDVAEPYG